MKHSITELLSELYLLDPALKNQEIELVKLLEKMTAHKPETHFNEAFKAELKSKLMKEIALNKKTGKEINWKSILTGFVAGGSAIGFAGYAFLQVIVPIQIPVASEMGISTTQTLAVAPIDFGFNKTEKGSAAFGSLPTFEASAGQRGTSLSREVTSMSALPGDAPTARGMASDVGRMIAPYEQKIYNYVYSGSGFSVDQKEMSVLQKKKNSLTSTEAQGFLKNFSLSNINLGSFASLNIGSMNLMEDTEYGLGLTIDFNEGVLGISKNWMKWPQEVCNNGICPQVTINEIPPDSRAIEIADTFFKKFSISLESYGKPVVNNDWRREYDRASDKSAVWIPRSISVTYPLIIEGREVFEEYGQPKGITVSIDIKTSLVTDIYGIEKLDFNASNYATETDVSKILEVAKNGGRTWGYPAREIGYSSVDSNSEKITAMDVRLGEPKLSYVQLNDYQSNISKQYLVPALVFPVLDTPKEGEYFQSTVIVPIIQEFFTRRENSLIMPMMEVK